jgi:hypothetical protein
LVVLCARLTRAQACKAFINDNAVTRANKSTAASKTPEMLAKHCDNLLKKGAVALPEDELEAQLNNVLIVFKVRAVRRGVGCSRALVQ